MVGGAYGLMSLGINLVWGVMGVVNPLRWLPAGIGMAFLVGVAAQRFLLGRVPPDRGAVKTSLLMTFGISYIVINSVQLLWGNEFQTVMFLPGSWQAGGLVFAKTRTVAFLAAGLISLSLWAFLRYTFAGRAIRAVSQNADGASVCGIDIPRTRVIAFGLGSALAGGAGGVLLTNFAISPRLGSGDTLRSFSVT